MANITVSTSSNFDDAANLGLLNGENITINSDAILTINSDVRWAQNAAVPNNIDINQGKLLIDATEVWWIPYDGGTGTVPALGTRGTQNVTRSGTAIGEFLGIWTALGVAPSASGGATPATGYLKLRSKSATLNDNDVLTLSNGATVTINSATGGQRGWIHYVGAEGTTSTNGRVAVPRLGELQTLGDWFVLGTSNGTSGQTFQHYVADFVPALQVETGNGTGVYEWWGNAIAADFTATLIATDERGRYFTSTSAGVITFGGATFGKLPPNGARIRVPNIHVSSSTSTNWAANTFNTTTPTNRHAFVSSGGSIDANYFILNGGMYSADSLSYKVANSCGADAAFYDHNTATPPNNISSVIFDNVSAARMQSTVQFASFSLLYCSNINYSNCASFHSSGSGTNQGSFIISNSSSITLDNCFALCGKSIDPVVINYCNGVTISNMKIASAATNQPISMTGNTDIIVTNLSITARVTETGSLGAYGISFTGCVNVLVDGVSKFQGTSSPSLYLVRALSQTKNIRIRNIGTRGSPLTMGTGRGTISLANSSDIFVSKIYSSAGTQTNDSVMSVLNCDNLVISDYGDPSAYSSQSLWLDATNTTFIKRSASGGAKIYQSTLANGRTPNTFTAFGTHFLEEEVSATEVQLTVNAGVEKSNYQSSIDAYTDDVGTILRDGTNGLLLRALNDQVTWTWNYWIRGLTGFANTTPVMSGTNTTNITLTYDIDKGTGFSGTFKAATGANLSGETGILPTGVKLKIRAKCTTANSANVLRSIGIYGITSGTDITGNYYPYNEPLVNVTGIVSGSLAAVFRNSDGKRLDTKSGTTEIKMYPEWFSNTTCTLRARKPGYDAVTSEFTLTESGLSYPVSQVDNTIANTNPGSLGITVTNHGASPVTWNGKQYSITITVTDSSTPAQIAQWISWHTAQDSFSLNNSFHNMAWPSMVIPAGTSFETQRGTLFGSAGASLKGVRIVDGSGNGIAGFTRFQADDGTYYQPPVSATFELTNLKNNTEVRVYKVSDMSELAGQENVTTGTFSYSYVWSSDIPILVSIVSIGYQNLQINSTLTATGTSIPIQQIIDRQYLNP